MSFVCPSVRLSLCLSVTRQYCTKTAKHRITQTMPFDSPGTLVFWHQRSRRNSNLGAKWWGRLHLHPAWARYTPFPPLLLPCPFTSSFFALYYLFPFSFSHHFTYFLLLSIRFLSTRIVPLRFQAWGRRRRPNLGLVCFVLWLCYLYCLVKIYSGILLYLV